MNKPNLDDTNDFDLDGLSAEQENVFRTNQNHPDSDGDGFSDGIEVLEGANPLDPASVPSITVFRAGELAKTAVLLDQDLDGLPDLYEVERGTLINEVDSDEDGYSDGAEILNQTDPLSPESPASLLDSDRDGLSDTTELLFGSDPTRMDADLDSLADVLEILYQTNPAHPDTNEDGILDGYQPGPRDYRFSNGGIHF